LAVVILILEIFIGQFIAYNRNNRNFTKSNSLQTYNQETRITLAKLESTLNKKEINAYFDQANLLLTEIMEVCDNRAITTDIKYINSRRVRILLRKNRLFNKDSYDAKWLVSHSLLKKIEWVLIEILMSEGKLDCNKQKCLLLLLCYYLSVTTIYGNSTDDFKVIKKSIKKFWLKLRQVYSIDF
jgi:hypothetical protein